MQSDVFNPEQFWWVCQKCKERWETSKDGLLMVANKMIILSLPSFSLFRSGDLDFHAWMQGLSFFLFLSHGVVMMIMAVIQRKAILLGNAWIIGDDQWRLAAAVDANAAAASAAVDHKMVIKHKKL